MEIIEETGKGRGAAWPLFSNSPCWKIRPKEKQEECQTSIIVRVMCTVQMRRNHNADALNEVRLREQTKQFFILDSFREACIIRTNGMSANWDSLGNPIIWWMREEHWYCFKIISNILNLLIETDISPSYLQLVPQFHKAWTYRGWISKTNNGG